MKSASKAAASHRLNQAVRRNRAFSSEGLLEIMFTWAFKGLVYPQIWEDPEVDLEALALTPQCHVVAIASGGCNVLSYLIADPGRITAVDLSRAHVALNRLKLAAARHLPSWQSFYRFFGEADEEANVNAYWRFLKDHLDDETRAYWEGAPSPPSAAAAFRCSRAISTATDCSATPSASAISSRAPTASS